MLIIIVRRSTYPCVVVSLCSTALPEQVVYSGSVRGETDIEYEDEIGPAIVHDYLVSTTAVCPSEGVVGCKETLCEVY